MSTWWTYQCQSHDPPLSEYPEGWPSKTQLAKDLAQRALIVAALDQEIIRDHLDHGEVRHWFWLSQHPNCDVALLSEYGDIERPEAM